MRELAVQGASDGVNTNDRASIKLEMDQLSAEITRIADSTEYNDTKVLGGGIKSVVDSSNASHTISTIEKHGAADGTTSFTSVLANQSNNNTKVGTYTISIIDSDGSTALTSSDTVANGDFIRLTDGAGNQYDREIATAEMTGQTLKAATYEYGASGIKLTTAEVTSFWTDGNVEGLDGKAIVVGNGATLQVGADNNSNNQIGFAIGTQTAAYLGVDSSTLGLSTTNTEFQTAIGKLDDAIKLVNDERGNIGAKQNRLEYTSSNLMNSVQNNAASMSTIRDADFAAEAADLAKNQILVQSGTAMLAQANGLSQNVLSLIR
jgi:flagellin